jgi:hypothetical protein
VTLLKKINHFLGKMASNNNNALLKKPVVGAPLNKPLPPKPKQEVIY